MKLLKLIQMLEACRDAVDDPRDTTVVFRNFHGERFTVDRFAHDWLEGRIEIDIGPERQPQEGER